MDDDLIPRLRDCCEPLSDAAADEIERLRAKLAELNRDAERYRWLMAERFMARVRRDALEEAAKRCEERALGNLQLGAVAHPVAHEMLDARDAEAQCCAVAIRALVTGKT